MIVFLSVIVLQGCATSSYVQVIGEDSYMVESYYNPQSVADRMSALTVMERKSENACKGNFVKVKEWQVPDMYWGDFVVYWEIECSRQPSIVL